MGIKGNVARTNLARANERRDWRIFAEFVQTLIAQARPLYIDDSEFIAAIDGTFYALDSTTIDLCLNIFPWAEFRKRKPVRGPAPDGAESNCILGWICRVLFRHLLRSQKHLFTT